MEASVFVHGVVLGFSIAAPVGPIGILCIRRSVAEGRLLGFVSGLGAATADALYGCVAGFGLSVLTQLLLGRQLWLRLLGGLALCYLGLRAYTARPAEMGATVTVSRSSVLAAYLGTFVLTLANPTTILAFAAMFAGLGVASESAGSYGRTALFVVGVFIGSASWWLLLSSAAAALRDKLQGPRLVLVNRVSGLTILAFGVAALLSSADAPQDSPRSSRALRFRRLLPRPGIAVPRPQADMRGLQRLANDRIYVLLQRFEIGFFAQPPAERLQRLLSVILPSVGKSAGR